MDGEDHDEHRDERKKPGCADRVSRRWFVRRVFGADGDVDVDALNNDLQYLVVFGRRFCGRPSPRGWPMGKPLLPVENASALALREPLLDFAMGFVWVPRRSTAVAHAWCVDRDDAIVETTWDCGTAVGDEVYYGATFSKETTANFFGAFWHRDWYVGFSMVARDEELRLRREREDSR